MPNPPPPSRNSDLARLTNLFEQPSSNGADAAISQVDDGDSDMVKIQVSTTVFGNASKPFKALFSKNFVEGQIDPAATSPRLIKIEDNPFALLDLCKILHLHSIWIAGAFCDFGFGPEAMFELGVVADKWGCIEALGLQSNGVLTKSIRIGYCIESPISTM